MTDGSTPDVTIRGVPLAEARDQAVRTATVAAACRVGVFRGLADGPAGPGALAARLEMDRRALSILLPALAELDLLEPDGDAFRLTPAARRCLGDPDDPAFAAGGLPHWLENLRDFTRLPEVVARGGPLEEGGEDGDGRSEERLARFMAAMAAAPEERVARLADRCVERLEPRHGGDGPPRLLDLGGGPGHMSRAFVERGFRATLFDRPETVSYVSDEYGLGRVPEVELVGGDFVEDDLPRGPFDVVLLSNVVHIYGPETNRRLVEKVGGVVRPGGVAAVADFFRGRSPRAAHFALVMLLKTEEGDTYSAGEIAGWLDGAGFEDFDVSDLDPERQLLTARRREDERPEGGEDEG